MIVTNFQTRWCIMVIMFLLRSASTSPTKQKLLHLPDMLAMKPLFSQPGKGASRDSAPRYSCRVLQRLIEHCRHQKLRKLLENLLNEARRPDLRLTFDSCCGIPRFGFGEKRKREREISILPPSACSAGHHGKSYPVSCKQPLHRPSNNMVFAVEHGVICG